jgi:hypothetical protein
MTDNSQIGNIDAIEKTDSFGNYLIHGIDEVILPDTVSWWPVAPGWQVLGLVLVVLLLVKVAGLIKRWWHNRYRREALRQLASIKHQAGMDLHDIVAVLPHYLKVTALQAYPRTQVASLSGSEWLTFLDAHCKGASFTSGVGKKMTSVAYLPREQWQLSDQDSNTLISMSLHWIARHKGVV